MAIIDRIKEGMFDEVVAGTAGDLTGGIAAGLGANSGLAHVAGDMTYVGTSMSQYDQRQKQWAEEKGGINDSYSDDIVAGMIGALNSATASTLGAPPKLASTIGLATAFAGIGGLQQERDNYISNPVAQVPQTQAHPQPTNFIENAAHQGVVNSPLSLGRGR